MLLDGENATGTTRKFPRLRNWLRDRWFQLALAGLLLLLVVSGAILISRPGLPLKAMGFLFDNLPLTLPVLTVVLTVLLRPHELATTDGWLRLATPFGLGLVSFAIWAYVAGQGSINI
jgi:hypothetical protein